MSKWNKYQSGSGQRADNMHAADEIFHLQAQRHQFSDQVMRAARKIKQYIATPADIQIINTALGNDVLHNVNVPTQTKIVGKKNASKYADYQRNKWAAEKKSMNASAGSTATSNPNAQAAKQSSTQSANASAPQQPVASAPQTPGPVSTSTPQITAPSMTQTANVTAPQLAQIARPAPGHAATIMPATQESVRSITQSANATAPKLSSAHTPDTGHVSSANPSTPIRLRTSKEVMKMARKVRGFTSKGVELPDRVGAAMDRAFDNTARAGDRGTFEGYINARSNMKKYLAGRARANDPISSLNSVTGVMQNAGQYAAMLRSGPVGILGAAGKASNQIQALVNNSAFKNEIVKAAGAALSNPKVAAAFFQKAGSFAKGAGATVGYIAAAAGIVKGIVGVGEMLGGMNGGENLRLLQSQAYINQLEGGRVSASRGRLDNLRLDKETRDLSGASWGAQLGFGRRSGQYAQMIGRGETEEDLKGFSGTLQNSSAIRKTARERAFRDQYGALGGHLMESFDRVRNWLGRPSEDSENEITAQAKKNIQRAGQLKELMYQRISEGAIGEADKLQKQIGKELDQNTTAWKSPGTIWANMDNARAAARVFPMTQQMRRLRSYE